MAALQLCRWSFHTKKLCCRLHSIEVNFNFKNDKIALWATLFGLRGYVRTPSIARWKARCRLYILLSPSLTVETL